MEDLARTDGTNPDPRIAVALLLDTSGSMDGEPINRLNEGFRAFCTAIQDPGGLARKRAEVLVITFGGTARVEIDFTQADELQPRSFGATGGTPMAAALDMAIDEIERQKETYRATGLDYFRPWLFVLTDGEPTDTVEEWRRVIARVRQAEASKKITVFPVGCGQANLNRLSEISAARSPVMVDGLRFVDMFVWLSKSLDTMGSSNRHGSNDTAVAQQEPITIPQPDWTTV